MSMDSLKRSLEDRESTQTSKKQHVESKSSVNTSLSTKLFQQIPRVKKTHKTKYLKDNVFGDLSMSAQIRNCVDKPEFQRLRRILQLGLTHFIYPPATHTRFQHCAQSGHWTEKFVLHLKANQPELLINDRIVFLLTLSGWWHDICHTLFSHSFDHHIAKPQGIPDHEERIGPLIRYMNKKYPDLTLSKEEEDLVIAVIQGNPIQGYPEWMFQIVANHQSELDTDKLAYESLDSANIGLPVNLQIERIIREARVVDNQICYRNDDSTYSILFTVFITRYNLFKMVYRHHAVVAIETMMKHALLSLDCVMKWKQTFLSPDMKWLNLTDELLHHLYLLPRDNLSSMELKSLEQAEYLIKRIETNRDIYFIEQLVLMNGKRTCEQDILETLQSSCHFVCNHCHETVQLDELLKESEEKHSPEAEFKIPSHELCKTTLGLSGAPMINPMNKVWFYNERLSADGKTIIYEKFTRQIREFSQVFAEIKTSEIVFYLICTKSKNSS